jgi:negative regulator of flagellin synthesis FlgM
VKIDSSIGPVGGSGGTSRPKPTTATTAKGAATTVEDSVQVSPLAGQLRDLEDVLAKVPAVDSQRVAEIKQAIAEGRFQVNPERIADGLIDSVRQMLSSRR